MGKNKYGAAKVLNVSVVGSVNAPANISKKNIAASDAFNAGQDYNQQGYRLPGPDWIYHIPSTIRKEYNKMSKAEKIVYGTIFASTLFGLAYASSDAVKKTVDKTYEKGAKFANEKYASVLAPAPAVVPVVPANTSAVATPQPKQPRTDIKVILGATRDEDITPQMVHGAKYLNESQKVPNENIKILKSSEFTYENFLKTVKEVGMSASDNDTIIINPSSDAGKGGFAFSKEGVKYNMSDGRTMDYRSYKIIAEAIKNNTNPNAKKLIFVDGCYSGSAIPIFEEAKIPNSAVITSTSADATSGASSMLDILLVSNSGIRKDYNNDGNISLKELYLTAKEIAERDNPDALPLAPGVVRGSPQIWDTSNITDELVLVDK